MLTNFALFILIFNKMALISTSTYRFTIISLELFQQVKIALTTLLMKSGLNSSNLSSLDYHV